MWQFAVFGGGQKGTLLKLVIPFFAEQALFVWGRQSFNLSSRLPTGDVKVKEGMVFHVGLTNRS